MRSLSIPLSANQKSSTLKNEQGFSLLEVVVALTILAGGFLTVLNLFSGSILSVDLSGQYLKAVTLANSKINELEILNFQGNEYSGKFKNEESYRWEVDITPHDSPLNNPDSNIQLQKILLKVFWQDRGQTRNVKLATLHLKGQAHPIPDLGLEKLLSGGTSSPGNPGEESETQETPKKSNLSGAITSIAPPAQPACSSGQVYLFGSGCT